jgi:hypothetical protein
METAAEHYKRHEIALYIETVKGNRFFFENPVFDVEEIAHALSMQCRYTGHTSRFYSVAEHSVLVARIMKRLDLGNPFEGLMHDATEAYLSDIAAPWKAMLPDYKVMEARLELPMRRHFGLPDTITDGCKRADWIALFVEARELIPSGAKDWIAPDGVKEAAAALPNLIECLAPEEARWEFLNSFGLLQ